MDTFLFSANWFLQAPIYACRTPSCFVYLWELLPPINNLRSFTSGVRIKIDVIYDCVHFYL